jgi:hypothetical protein
MRKDYQYLLLDLDGTITDPMIGITRSVEYALSYFNIKVNRPGRTLSLHWPSSY